MKHTPQKRFLIKRKKPYQNRVFKFETTEPKEARRVAKSLDMAIVLFEITHNLKGKVENFSGDSFDAIEYVFEEIYKELDAYSIDIHDLID